MGFSLTAGDDRVLDLVMKDPADAAVDITGATLTWRAAATYLGAVVIEKVANITTPLQGLFSVALVPADTTGKFGTYHHWVRMVQGGIVSTIYYGTFSIDPVSVVGSIAAFKDRFPEFALVSDSLIGAIFAEVAPDVSDRWRANDRSFAIQYLVAHRLAMEGYGTVINKAVGIGGVGAVKRRKVGDVEVELATASGGSSGNGGTASEYSLTTYGQAYLRLLRANFSAVAVV